MDQLRILPDRQRGAALLMAMVIVTVVATIASSMVWQQWRAVQVESAERGRAQSQWVLSGALDWARLILREDAITSSGQRVDHLGEPWAHELAEARVSTFLAIDKDNTDDAPDAFLSGKIDDASGRYNLRNVLNSGSGVVDTKQLAVLKRLFSNIGLDSTLAETLAYKLQKATQATMSTPEALAALGGEAGRSKAPLLPQTLDQLVWLGLDAGLVQRLRPFVTVLPLSSPDTSVNVNTAPKEVIAALIENLDLSGGERIVRQRQAHYFEKISDVQDLLGKAYAVPSGPTGLDVTSSFFEVRGRLRLEDQVLEQRHLVWRKANSAIPELSVVHQDRFSGVDAGGGGAW
ncbi:MAG: type II secretion system minor pseudopilin GspK [Burkholderiales bacterium]|nr:type II secretion system minor pseudopilin GspK [Burkholderiales bacterium]